MRRLASRPGIYRTAGRWEPPGRAAPRRRARVECRRRCRTSRPSCSGIVQGLTEFLPISSSGHLIIVPWLQDYTFLLENEQFNKTFDVALHAGTLIAAIAYFRREVVLPGPRLRRRGAPARDPQRRAAARGGDRDRHDPGGDRRRARLRLHRRTPRRAVDDRPAADLLRRPARLGRPHAPAPQRCTRRTLRDGWYIGLAQVLALAPGTSRSGITITAGRWLGLDRDGAARFSFLLLIPIVAGATVFKGVSAVHEGLPSGVAGPMVVGTIAAAVSGYLAIAFLLRLVRTDQLPPLRLLPLRCRRRDPADHRHRPAARHLLAALNPFPRNFEARRPVKIL